MNLQKIGDDYVISWTLTRLIAVINITAGEKQELIMLLRGDPDANRVGNPVRGLIVDTVINRRSGTEIWRVFSEMTEDEIHQAWLGDNEELKATIRSVGELVFDY